LDPKLSGKWEPDPDPKKNVADPQHWHCCGSRSGSAKIQNFLDDPDKDPELEVMDPDPAPDPELDFNLIINHQNYYQFDNYDIKNALIYRFL
jgi:hypothetical protein